MTTNRPSGISRVARDVLDLCELQLQLLSVDSQEAKRKATRAMIFHAVALALGGSAVTTLMIGGGFLLHDWAGWTIGASLVTVSGVMLLIVAGLLMSAMRATSEASAAMHETKSEFVENLKWLKAVLINPETSARNQLRAESFASSSSQSAAADSERSPESNSRFSSR
ncbi:hypothetical protein Poly24_31920 [Rosistilla carotiformis]|uniref:Phage holin family protein n=1 Tax=Rosistilla carotiformis TaxID=2528017 RepID=A0A518JVC4_9BACT|nr:phage holin family protein [Rosistilla carotiformis]QDV69476.1 hypothetical protein Poly24_31920 [Rosistilla carotiformis]